MKRGTKPTPTAILKLRGTFRPCRHTGAVEAPASRPIMPRWLKGEARKEWQRLVPELMAVGIITRLDRDLLAIYCHTFAEYLDLLKLTDATRPIIRTTNRNIIQNPVLGILNRTITRLIRIGAELGLSPTSRAGLRIQPRGDAGTATAGLAKFQRVAERQEAGPYTPKPPKPDSADEPENA